MNGVLLWLLCRSSVNGALCELRQVYSCVNIRFFVPIALAPPHPANLGTAPSGIQGAWIGDRCSDHSDPGFRFEHQSCHLGKRHVTAAHSPYPSNKRHRFSVPLAQLLAANWGWGWGWGGGDSPAICWVGGQCSLFVGKRYCWFFIHFPPLLLKCQDEAWLREGIPTHSDLWVQGGSSKGHRGGGREGGQRALDLHFFKRKVIF